MYYDRIELTRLNLIDVAKNNNSKECVVSHYWYFNHEFKFQNSFFFNGCHDLTMLYVNFSDFAIITVKGVDYCCINHDVSKSEAIHMMGSYVLDDCGYI